LVWFISCALCYYRARLNERYAPSSPADSINTNLCCRVTSCHSLKPERVVSDTVCVTVCVVAHNTPPTTCGWWPVPPAHSPAGGSWRKAFISFLPSSDNSKGTPKEISRIAVLYLGANRLERCEHKMTTTVRSKDTTKGEGERREAATRNEPQGLVPEHTCFPNRLAKQAVAQRRPQEPYHHR